MTKFEIDITSDIVCPWCYIGHARLNRAIESHLSRHPTDSFSLKYKPFYLNPPTSTSTSSFPVESYSRRARMEQKFGARRTDQITDMLAEAARSEGLNFKFGGMTGSSRNGHRLVYHAQKSQNENQESLQNKVMLGLWRRYYEEEIDITKLDVLVQVGLEAGLSSSAEEIREYLLSGRDGDVVDRLADEAQDQEISGVPHYVVQDTWAVSGAQEPKVFEQLFERYKKLEAEGIKTK